MLEIFCSKLKLWKIGTWSWKFYGKNATFWKVVYAYEPNKLYNTFPNKIFTKY